MMALYGMAAEPAQGQNARPSSAALAAAVDSLAARVVASGVSPAIGVAVVMDGRTIYAKGHGWLDATNRVAVDDRTLWYIASTSKSFTGFGAALLAHQNVLRFSDPIATLLPGVTWPEGVDAQRLTLGHFLSHTQGINDVAVVQTSAFTGAVPEARWPQLLRYGQRARVDELRYSNLGYVVTAMVIDRKRPEGWKRYLDSAVFRPAGMTETYARTSGLEARIAKPHEFAAGGFSTLAFPKADLTMNAAGGHLATLRDLARWVTVQMDGGMIDGRRVFPVEAVALSQRLIAPQTRDAARRFAYFDREGWAAGWDIGSYRGEPMVSRFGSYSSTRSHLSMLPRRRIGVVAMTTGPAASLATDIVAALAYDLEAGRIDARAVAAARLDSLARRQAAARAQAAASDSTRRARQQPLRRPLADFAGSYTHDAFGTITFEVRGNALYYRWGVLSGPAEVYDAADHVLRIEIVDDGTTVPFRFGGRGPARSIEVRGETFTRR
jgi:CubicO group peptidase (beta-lactamase class C family)